MNKQVVGKVKQVKKLWWIKINTKPIRCSMNDGAVFPHRIRVTYVIDNHQYENSKLILWKDDIPKENDDILVDYNDNKPNKILKLTKVHK